MAAFGDLFRAALPSTWADGAWRSVSVPIMIDGVAQSNAAAPCSGYHYKVGHEVRADGNTLTYVTWTLENQEIKENAMYEFAIFWPPGIIIMKDLSTWLQKNNGGMDARV